MENRNYLQEVIEMLEKSDSNRDLAVDLFKRKYKLIVKNVQKEQLKSIEPSNHIQLILLEALLVGVLFEKQDYKSCVEYVETNIKDALLGRIRSYDVFISKIMKSYYISRRVLKMDNSLFFSFLVPNKEMGNEETVSVLTNCILDFLISQNIYLRLENKITSTSEQAKYNYYHGIIDLVEMEYDQALEHFHHSAILSVNKNLSLMLEKYIIVCMLIKSNYNIPYCYNKKTKTYYDLVRVVKRADVKEFDHFVEENKEEFMRDKLYFIVQRLSQNVVQEGLRKISLVYSRITYRDISNKLEMDIEDVDYIIKKTISQGLIKGEVKDNVFYSLKDGKRFKDINVAIKDSIYLTTCIGEQMKYPKIEPLCYEKVVQ